jgi:predicted RNA binding protein YcfA (HicA-like mRNA interferase family)
VPPTDFSGRDVVKVLAKNGYRITNRSGSHVRMEYQSPVNPDDVRKVTVPMHSRIREGTLRNIADQCEADSFRKWCHWIDRQR